MCLDGDITRGELGLTRVEEREILLEHKEVLRPIVAGQRTDDLGLGGAAPVIAVLRQLLRVSPAVHDIAENPEPRHPGDVTDRERELGFIWTRAFCMRWMWVPALSMIV